MNQKVQTKPSLTLMTFSPFSPTAKSMTMESGAEVHQGGDTAVSETDSQQISQAQIATLAQVSSLPIYLPHTSTV